MIYLFLAEGFEEIEALTVVDGLRRADIEVKTVAIGKTIGAHRIEVKADSDRLGDDLDGVILPGGMPGTDNLEKSDTVKNAVLKCAEEGKLIGAICAAPSLLGKWGLLKNKRATCYPGFEKYLEGASLTSGVVTDGNIITAEGAGVAWDFTLEVIKYLKGEEKANRIKEQIRCPK